MKGLANCAPDKWTTLKVKNRKARKHYGMEWRTVYDEKLHKHLSSTKHWCGMDGCWKVYSMEWFIKRVRSNLLSIHSSLESADHYHQGDPVSENKPYYTSFVWTGLVSQGRIRKIKMSIYADQTDREAPVGRDENVKLLARVEADVSHIPEYKLARRKESDGEYYYDLSCQIEAVYLSASTTYTLLYNSENPPMRRFAGCLLTRS